MDLFWHLFQFQFFSNEIMMMCQKEDLFNFVSALPTINQMVIELREIEAGNDSRGGWK